MKRFFVATLSFTLWVLNSFSLGFGTHWISSPLPNDSSEVLFRRTYVSRYKPIKATITVASTGKLRIYVNERNISQEVIIGNRKQANAVKFYTYDITRFMQPDSNIIAVWYAPDSQPFEGKQLSLEYHGIDEQGKHFYHNTDKSWFCKAINSYTKDGTEFFDGSSFQKAWKNIDQNTRGWFRPLGSAHDKSYATSETYPIDSIYVLSKKISPIAVYIDSTGIHADFGRPFNGTIRVTLRNARRDEHIMMGNFTYVCSGEMDEQCFRRFTESHERIIHIMGDKYFDPKQIQNIEGLEMQLVPHKSYLY